jgi:hypothetical protein
MQGTDALLLGQMITDSKHDTRELRRDIRCLDKRVSALEKSRKKRKWFHWEPTPIQMVQVGLGIGLVLAAVTKKITWDQAIPFFGKLIGA